VTGIKEVADEVGLSMATVSRALRGLRGVSAGNRVRVQEAAQRLGYVASSTAVGLATGRTRTIAVVVPHVTRWYFTSLIHGAEGVLSDRGYDLMLLNLNESTEARHRAMQTNNLSKRSDAVLVLGLRPTLEEQSWLEDNGAKVVLVGTSLESWPSVSIDDVRVAEIAVQHLIDLGHTRIAYVGGSARQALELAPSSARQRGYHQTMAAAGLELVPELDHQGDFTLASGRKAGHALLSQPHPPTAVFCASDEMAIGMLRAARELDVSVPDQLSVIGVDDHELAEYVDLTTVRQPVEELGRVAAFKTLRLLGDLEPDADDPVNRLLDIELVQRGSTAPPG
jgi:LacI family repressor for deo operon, udp, cdd, tsx, nupC, and nupG